MNPGIYGQVLSIFDQDIARNVPFLFQCGSKRCDDVLLHVRHSYFLDQLKGSGATQPILSDQLLVHESLFRVTDAVQ